MSMNNKAGIYSIQYPNIEEHKQIVAVVNFETAPCSTRPKYAIDVILERGETTFKWPHLGLDESNLWSYCNKFHPGFTII